METVHILSAVIFFLLIMIAYIVVQVLNPRKPIDDAVLAAHGNKIKENEHKITRLQHDLTVQADKLEIALEDPVVEEEKPANPKETLKKVK